MTLAGYDTNIFLSSLGSFWTQIFEDKGFLDALLLGNEINIGNEYLRFCEIVLGESVHDIPVFNRKTWTNVIFQESAIDVGLGIFYRYGDEDLEYGDGFTYGSKKPDSDISFFLPEEIIDIGEFICNKIYNPSLVLTKGKEFSVESGTIHFAENLFDNDLVPKRNIVDEFGNIIDREISLWIPTASFDRSSLWRKYGTLVDVRQESSEGYKMILKNIFALYYIGPKKLLIEGYINQIFQLPVVKNVQEDVRYIVRDVDADKTTVYTDKEIYTVSPAMSMNQKIEVGKILPQFTPISNAVKILEDSTHPNWWRSKNYFSIPEKFLGPGYFGPVAVKNEMITIKNEVSAHTKFPLYGDISEEQQAELDKFTLHVGIGVKVGDTHIDLNTLNYIVGQMHSNLFGIQLDPTLVDYAATAKSSLFKILNRVLPANISYVMLLEIESLESEYDINTVADEIELLDGWTLSDTILTEVDIKDGFWGVAKLDGWHTVGSGVQVGQIVYSGYPHIQESIKD